MQESALERRSLIRDSNTTVYGSTFNTEAGLKSKMSTSSQVMNGVPQTMAAHNTDNDSDIETVFCNVCFRSKPTGVFTLFQECGHRFCTECVVRVFEKNITESRVGLQCLQCTAHVTPEEVKAILTPDFYEKYLDFSLKRYLATVPNVHYCPSPDCPYACINVLEKDDPETNHFVCARDECHREYCYMCKCPWHPDKSCQRAREEVAITMPEATASISPDDLKALNVRQCPFCSVRAEKLDDGSCNQVECINCGGSFCWLCGKSVTEMHYLSPTGCPMYGQQRWSRKKKYCCRFWLWFTAPFLILLSAFLAFPIIIIGFPILIGYVIFKCFSHDRCLAATCCAVTVFLSVLICLLLDPLVAILGILILVPLEVFYIYCFIPVHVCLQSS